MQLTSAIPQKDPQARCNMLKYLCQGRKSPARFSGHIILSYTFSLECFMAAKLQCWDLLQDFLFDFLQYYWYYYGKVLEDEL